MAPPLTAEQIAQIREVVNRVLTSWVGYQLALTNQAAGAQTGQLNQMLHEELALLLIERADLDKYDIEDWLEDAFDENFNLRLEDDSIGEMSQILFECTSLVRKLTPDGVANILSRLPNSDQTRAKAQQSALKLESDDESEPEEMMA